MMCSTCSTSHGELHHRQAVQVAVHDHVGDVAMDEQFARQQADDLVRRHAAVGAADPQVLGPLLPRQVGEEVRTAAADALGPGPVVVEKVRERAHLVQAIAATARAAITETRCARYAAEPCRSLLSSAGVDLHRLRGVGREALRQRLLERLRAEHATAPRRSPRRARRLRRLRDEHADQREARRRLRELHVRRLLRNREAAPT